MFITNICALFHLRGKENFANHQKVSKDDENDCREKYFSSL